MTHFETALNQMKQKLIKKAKKHGIYENFGQAELRKLKDVWENSPMYNEAAMDDFYNWVTTFTP